MSAGGDARTHGHPPAGGAGAGGTGAGGTVPPAWEPVGDAVLRALAAVSARCLAADGGLPVAADPDFLRGRWAVPSAVAAVLRAADGAVSGVVAARPAPAGGVVLAGLVDPAARGRGVGARLLDAGLARAAAHGLAPTVEAESLTPAAHRLFASRGLRRVFAEDVLRADLGAPPPAAAPVPGLHTVTWTPDAAPRFHAVYRAAFRERPGFPDPPAGRWIADLTGDDDFRPQRSLLAVLPDVGDAGFVTVAAGWIDQIGVVPAARGRGVGAALLHRALAGLRADGDAAAHLTVAVDNPARRLYRRLGFAPAGRRARYRPA